MSNHLVRALAYALSGQDLPDPPGEVAELDAFLASHGWDRDRLDAHVRQCRQDHHPWPHPLPAEVAEGVPAAQFLSVLGRIRVQWQLGTTASRVRTTTRAPGARGRTSAHDQQLLADVPPHFGKL